MIENWQIKFIDRVDTLGREMHIYRKTDNGQIEILVFPQDLQAKMIKEGETIPHGLYLSDNMFQQLVDAIHKDFKPSEGKFTEGKLEATEKHLQDMRKLLKLS